MAGEAKKIELSPESKVALATYQHNYSKNGPLCKQDPETLRKNQENVDTKLERGRGKREDKRKQQNKKKRETKKNENSDNRTNFINNNGTNFINTCSVQTTSSTSNDYRWKQP
jgi:hypothetical protein